MLLLLVEIFASNNDYLPSSPSYDIPDQDWFMNDDYYGIRGYVGVGKKSNSNYSLFLMEVP